MLDLQNPFVEVAVLLGLAAVLGGAAIRLRQPLIVAFIAVGILAGPSGLAWSQGGAYLQVLAQVGIAVLLFVVGLKLDVQLIRSMGPVALATGLGQVGFTSLVGYVLARLLGMEPVTALYVAVALTFSSTIIIVKLLSDKREIDALHGRIAVGFLIVQDIVVVLVMIGLNAFAAGQGDGGAWRAMGLVVLKGLAMLATLAVLMRFVLTPVLHQLARSPELLVLFAIAWAVTLATAGDALGFSKEVGAFLGGVSLASTPYREVIGARLVSVRDFLLLFFFIQLGAELDLSRVGAQLGAAMVLSVFVLVGNPLIVLAIMGFMGYRRRTSFLAGLTVAQISEFSLILAALGLSLGHIDNDTVGLITLVGLVTIGLSTYLILYSHPIYQRLRPALRLFEREVPHREKAHDASPGNGSPDVILFGLGRFGGAIARALRARGVRVLGVDFDPHAVNAWRAEGLQALYGDAEDPEFPAHLPLAGVRTVVGTMPARDVNAVLIQSLRRQGFEGRVVVTAHHDADADALRRCGADTVLLPFVDAAASAVETMLPRPD